MSLHNLQIGIFGVNDVVSGVNVSAAMFSSVPGLLYTSLGDALLRGLIKGVVDRPMEYPHGSYPSQSYGSPPDLSIQFFLSNAKLNVY